MSPTERESGAPEHAWEVRVGSSGRDAARVFVRSHQLEMGQAISFDRDDPRVSSLEHVLGAVGSDLVLGFRRLAWKRRLEVESVEATVRATLTNPLTYLGVVGEEGDPALATIQVRLYVGTPEEPAKVREVWEQAVAVSPLACTFRRLLDLELTLKTVP